MAEFVYFLNINYSEKSVKGGTIAKRTAFSLNRESERQDIASPFLPGY